MEEQIHNRKMVQTESAKERHELRDTYVYFSKRAVKNMVNLPPELIHKHLQNLDEDYVWTRFNRIDMHSNSHFRKANASKVVTTNSA